MANSIRTPRQGLTPGSRRIALAVDNEEWQKFRVSLKGKSTTVKLRKLRLYHGDQDVATHDGATLGDIDTSDCDVCIRVDNYIKALCRGGQLHAGESLQTARDCDWQLEIKKD